MGDDRQRPLPFKFKSGLGPSRLRPPKTWRLPDGSIARVCPLCGCDRERRCTIILDDDGVFVDAGVCVPAGVFGRRVCSGCTETLKKDGE